MVFNGTFVYICRVLAGLFRVSSGDAFPQRAPTVEACF